MSSCLWKAIIPRPGRDQRVRFLVTSLNWNTPLVIREMKAFPNNRDAMARAIYQNIYCPRGNMENRIKDCQLDLFDHQTSAYGFKPNQLHLMFAAFVYVLMTQLRLHALKGTDLARAAPDTIRQKLLRIGARITTSIRRIKISMPTACPYQNIFFTAWLALRTPTQTRNFPTTLQNTPNAARAKAFTCIVSDETDTIG